MEHTGKRALVLAGGGAKGSYQIGVWRALQELDWTPDIITGASVGTLNGCLFTMGKIQEAEDLWRSLEIHDVLEVPATLKPEELRAFFLDIIRSGGLNVEPLAEMIDRLIDEDAVRTSPIHFGLVMTELGSLRSVQCPIEDIPEGQLKDYMLASSACFPALRPREIDGVKYIDGGWRDNMPLDLAAKMGAAELLGVDVDGIGIVRPNTTGLPTRIVGIGARRWTLTPPAPGATSRWATLTRCGCLAAAAARPTPCCPTMRNFWLALPSNTKSCWPRSAPAHRKLTLWRKTRGCAQTTRHPMHRTRVRPPAAHWPRWSWPPSTSACPRTCSAIIRGSSHRAAFEITDTPQVIPAFRRSSVASRPSACQ